MKAGMIENALLLLRSDEMESQRHASAVRHPVLERNRRLDPGLRRGDGAMLAEREGIVIGSRAGVTRIQVQPTTVCAGCGSRGTCTSSSAMATPQFIDVRLSAPTVPGAHVTVSLPESSVALAAVLGYLLPALGLLFGALVATVLFAGDLPAVLGAVLGLVAGLIAVRIASKRFSRSHITPAVCPSTHFSGDPS